MLPNQILKKLLTELLITINNLLLKINRVNKYEINRNKGSIAILQIAKYKTFIMKHVKHTVNLLANTWGL